MTLLQAVFVIGGLLICSCAAAEDVLVLTKDNFDSTVNNADIILVEFYAPWCGHCKKLEPEYAAAATELKKNDPPVLLAKVDATVETDLGNRFGVRGYPTLKIFRKGSVSDYGGPRDTRGIVNYMQKQVGPSAKPLASVQEVESFISNNKDVSIIGFFSSKDGILAKTFLSLTDALRDEFKFGVTYEKAVRDHYEQSQGVVMFKSFDDKKSVYTGKESSKDELKDWIYLKSVAVAGELTKENQDRYKKRNLPIVKVYFDVDYASNLKRTNYYLNRIKKVAEHSDVQNKLLFAAVEKSDFRDEIANFGLDYNAAVSVAIDDFANNQKYRMTGEFGVDTLLSFAKDFLGKKLKSYIKSEPIPTQEGPVTVVVGETFNDIVLDKTKDVMIEMYAPWCGHCKKLAPIYDELAAKLKADGVQNVVIAKVDATANDSPHGSYQAKGYPTILFAPANNKDSPLKYEGERTVDAMYSWIKQKSSSWVVKKEEL